MVGLPNIIYQIANDWPQLKMAGAIEEDKGAESRILFVPLQLALLGMFLVPVWVAGIVTLFRDRRLRAVAVASLPGALRPGAGDRRAAVLHARPGAGALRGRLGAGGGAGSAGTAGSWWRRVALNLAVSVLVALPVLPVGTLAKTPIADINQAVSDQIGWPVYVRQITDVYAALPAADRERAVIVTANYGEAGALDRYGRDLPGVYSGHNELWYRGATAGRGRPC